MFQSVAQVTAAGRARQGGPQGYQAFNGLGDIPITYPSLGGRATVNAPDNWYSMTADQKRIWIQQSNLGPGAAIDFEHSQGLDLEQTPTPVILGLPTQQQQQRPTPDYVRAGDVVRVSFNYSHPSGWSAISLFPVSGPSAAYDPLPALAQAINSAPGGLSYVSGQATHAGADALYVDVAVREDHAHLIDISSIVSGAAQSTGLTAISGLTAQFVSKVEQNGALVPKSLSPLSPGWSTQSLLGISAGTAILGAGAILLLLMLRR